MPQSTIRGVSGLASTRALGEKCAGCPLAGPAGTFGFLLRPENRSVVERYSRLRTFQRGETILAQDEPVDGWQVLRSGGARVFIADEEGRERTVRFAAPGDLIGGCAGDALGTPHGNCYSVVATAGGTEVCQFPSRSLARLFEECPSLAEAFLGLMVRHLADSYQRLHALSTTTVRERLIDALVRLAEASRDDGGPDGAAAGSGAAAGAVTLRLARQQLADILGVTKETAVRALGSLKDQGLVRSKGQTIIIPDLAALRSLLPGSAPESARR